MVGIDGAGIAVLRAPERVVRDDGPGPLLADDPDDLLAQRAQLELHITIGQAQELDAVHPELGRGMSLLVFPDRPDLLPALRWVGRTPISARDQDELNFLAAVGETRSEPPRVDLDVVRVRADRKDRAADLLESADSAHRKSATIAGTLTPQGSGSSTRSNR